MKINTKLAEPIIQIKAKDFEYIKAIRKPNADTKIKLQFWIKCKNKQHKKS